MKQTFKYALILGLICFLASSVLAVVNSVTEPIIKAQKKEQESLALKELLPQAAMFKPYYDDEEKMLFYRGYDSSNQLDGFVLKSGQRGYSSDIEVLVSLDLNLRIISIKILSQNETPALGNRIMEIPFLEQFKNKSLESLKEVQAISGATISSAAVINSAKKKILELQNRLLEEIKSGG